MGGILTTGCEPPIPWIGGKTILLPVIKRIIPEGQNKFVDVFGGGGSVSLSGKYAPIQIYNDYNQHLTNFYTIIKTRCRNLVNAFAGAFGKDGKLVEEIEQRIFANIRDQFNACCLVFYRADTFEEFYDSILKMLNKAGSIQDKQHVWMNSMLAWELYKKREKDPDLFDALMFLILMKCSFSATGKSWACKGTNAETAIRLINEASRVLQHIAVDNRDCLDIIRLHDSPTTIFYCDPPYYMAEKCYSGVPLFGDMMHKALHDALLKCKAKVIISYNECDFIDELYSEDKWFIMRLDRPHSMLLHSNPGAVYHEVIIANFDIFEMYYGNGQLTLMDMSDTINEEGRIIL